MYARRCIAFVSAGLLIVQAGAAAAGPTNRNGVKEYVVRVPFSESRKVAYSLRSGYGYPARAGSADRVIEIRRGRKLVTVTNGETILFKVYGKAFAWKFESVPGHANFDLEEIAPQDVDVRGIRVYCVPDLYQRSN